MRLYRHTRCLSIIMVSGNCPLLSLLFCPGRFVMDTYLLPSTPNQSQLMYSEQKVFNGNCNGNPNGGGFMPIANSAAASTPLALQLPNVALNSTPFSTQMQLETFTEHVIEAAVYLNDCRQRVSMSSQHGFSLVKRVTVKAQCNVSTRSSGYR